MPLPQQPHQQSPNLKDDQQLARCSANIDIDRRRQLVAPAQRMFSQSNIRQARNAARLAQQRESREKRVLNARGGSDKMEYDMYLDQKAQDERNAQKQADLLDQYINPDEYFDEQEMEELAAIEAQEQAELDYLLSLQTSQS